MTDLTAAPPAPHYLHLTASIVSAYVRANPVAADGLSAIIGNIHGTLSALGDPENASGIAEKPPAVPIKKSVTADYVVCLEDGKRLKMLKRYLRSRFNLTPDAYRTRWGLPHDYPMVAPNYAKRRSDLAKQSGLGRGGRSARKPKTKK